jgi:teichuronic acid biosynthesis glycosyltransferase TuaG
MPFFSVVVPNYNRGPYLDECIESVLKQTEQDFEVIIVDDGSKDSSREILAKYKNHPKIKIHLQENCGLPSKVRNTAALMARGEWLAFLDSDDAWFSEKLKKTRLAIEQNPTAVLVAHWETVYDERTPIKVTSFREPNSQNQYLDLLFNGNFLSTSTVAVKKSAFDSVRGFSEKKEYFIVEDYDLWLRLAEKGLFVMLKESLALYRIFDGNISGNIPKLHDNLSSLIRDHICALNISEKEKNKLLREHLARVEYYRGRSYQLQRSFSPSIQSLWKSIVLYPWSLKKYLALGLSLMRVSR